MGRVQKKKKNQTPELFASLEKEKEGQSCS